MLFNEEGQANAWPSSLNRGHILWSVVEVILGVVFSIPILLLGKGIMNEVGAHSQCLCASGLGILVYFGIFPAVA